MTSDDSTEHLQTDKEFTHNATAQWEGPSVASHSITSHHPVTEARTVREVPVTDLRDVDTPTLSLKLIAPTFPQPIESENARCSLLPPTAPLRTLRTPTPQMLSLKPPAGK